MSLKDEFLKSLVGQQKDGKIRFALTIMVILLI